jgi:hypothetical protein
VSRYYPERPIDPPDQQYMTRPDLTRIEERARELAAEEWDNGGEWATEWLYDSRDWKELAEVIMSLARYQSCTDTDRVRLDNGTEKLKMAWIEYAYETAHFWDMACELNRQENEDE